MKYTKILSLISVSLLPFVVSAQAPLFKTGSLIDEVRYLIESTIIPLAFTMSLLYFFWGVAKYIRSEGNAKAEGKQIMWWGIIALFVISSVWGLVFYLRDELLVTDDSTIVIPSARTGRGGAGGTGGTGGTGAADLGDSDYVD